MILLHYIDWNMSTTVPFRHRGVSGVNFPRYQRSVKIVDIFINKTATGDSITLPPVAVYILEYSFVQLKHGHSFIGFKSWCPTINAFGNCLRSSRNRPAGNPVVQACGYRQDTLGHPVLLRSRYLSSGSCGYGSVPRPFREDGHGGSLRRV